MDPAGALVANALPPDSAVVPVVLALYSSLATLEKQGRWPDSGAREPNDARSPQNTDDDDDDHGHANDDVEAICRRLVGVGGRLIITHGTGRRENAYTPSRRASAPASLLGSWRSTVRRSAPATGLLNPGATVTCSAILVTKSAPTTTAPSVMASRRN